MVQNFDSGDRDHERWTLKENYQVKKRTELTSTYTQRCIISCENFFQSNRVCFHSWRVPLVAQMAKNMPAMQEAQVQSLGQEDPLEKEVATHSIILAWRIPWTEEPGGLQSMGSQKVGKD